MSDASSQPQIPPIPQVPIADASGMANREWWRWFQLMSRAVTNAMQWVLPPVQPPSPPASGWVLFTDASDGDKLKALAANNTIVTLGTP
jgi:hypothetical protein